MSGSFVNLKQFKDLGNRLSAQFTGLPFTVYRPSSVFATPTIAPTASTPVATLPALFTGNKKGDIPVGYAKPSWYAYIDTAIVYVGDVLVEVAAQPGQEIRRFFVAADDPEVPTLAVRCNRILTVKRANPDDDTNNTEDDNAVGDVGLVGALELEGDEKTEETTLMAGYPASMLQGTKGEKSELNLPTDTRDAWYSVLLPWGGVELQESDVLYDETGRRYLVSSTERTDKGWRLSAAYAG